MENIKENDKNRRWWEGERVDPCGFLCFSNFFFFSFFSFSFLFREHLVLIFGIFCFVKIVRRRSGNVQGHSGSIRRTGQVRMTRGYFQN